MAARRETDGQFFVIPLRAILDNWSRFTRLRWRANSFCPERLRHLQPGFFTRDRRGRTNVWQAPYPSAADYSFLRRKLKSTGALGLST
jgi:hypothetical protein